MSQSAEKDVPYPLEGWIALKSGDHQADVIRGGCTCGFAIWSPEHVAIMAYREAVDCAPRTRPTSPGSGRTEGAGS